MSDKGKSITCKDVEKDVEVLNADFEKKMKALKLNPRATKEAKKSLQLSQKQMFDVLRKTFGDDPIPPKEAEKVVKKHADKWVKLIHVKPDPRLTADQADGVAFTFGSKLFSVGVKLKVDPKKQMLKFEPAAAMKIRF